MMKNLQVTAGQEEINYFFALIPFIKDNLLILCCNQQRMLA